MVYVSANPDVPAEKVDDFVVSKGAYIRSAQRKFREMAQYAPQPNSMSVERLSICWAEESA